MTLASFSSSLDAALHHAETIRCGPIRELCDAFDSMSGVTFIGACAVLLVVLAIFDRVITNRISNR